MNILTVASEYFFENVVYVKKNINNFTKMMVITFKHITDEYNRPMCMAVVDYKNTFDSIGTWAGLYALLQCHIDWRYMEVH